MSNILGIKQLIILLDVSVMDQITCIAVTRLISRIKTNDKQIKFQSCDLSYSWDKEKRVNLNCPFNTDLRQISAVCHVDFFFFFFFEIAPGIIRLVNAWVHLVKKI